jgi:hypothetical protein
VLVPAEPGPLVALDSHAPEPHDEVGQIVDELFGPAPEGGPGLFDIALLTVGVGLVLWSVLGLHSTLVTVLGGAAVVLGLVLPARSAWRRASDAGSRRRRKAGTGAILLASGDPPVRDLVDAYGALLDAAALPGVSLGPEAVAAAHLAVIECAELVGDRFPATSAEMEYVERRVEAIRALTVALRAAGSQKSARALAGEELDARGLSSLQELADLERALGSDRDD